MAVIFSLSALAAFILIIVCLSDYNRQKWLQIRFSPILFLIGLTLLIRFLLINVNSGYVNDINTFQFWADALYEKGLGSFYQQDFFSDYPPGYMYVLWVVGAIKSLLDLNSEAYNVLIKIPAIICDTVAVAVIYRVAIKKAKSGVAFLLALAYALNPAVILDSSIWGQVDAVHTLAMLLSVYTLTEKRRELSYLLYGVSILIKPQSLVLAPIYIFDALEAVFFEAENLNRSLRAALMIFLRWILTLVILILLMLPFVPNLSFKPIIKQYIDTLSSYPYASVNAYNLFAFVGGNWKNAGDIFIWGLSYEICGYIFIFLITLFSLFILYLGRHCKSSKFFVSGALYSLTFLLSVRMHERYLFPALIFFLLAFIYRRDKNFMLFYGGYSLITFVNCADIIHLLQNENNMELIEVSMPVISLLNIILCGIMVIVSILVYKNNNAYKSEACDLPIEREYIPMESSSPPLTLHRRDIMAISILICVYTPIAFINLGDTQFPQTAWIAAENQFVVFQQSKTAIIKSIGILLGSRHDKRYKISASDNLSHWRAIVDIDENMPFAWEFHEVDISEQYIRLDSLDNDLMIQELAFLDEEKESVPVKIVESDHLEKSHLLINDFSQTDPLISSNPEFLCDEQDLIAHERTNLNGTYFDEIYHARTAYEFVHHLTVYEWTHPPLGKAMISLGILLFGMTPFGWRFTGALVGVLMIPVIYILAKKLFLKTRWAFFAAFLFTFDFMHFAQTRISTIDVYVTFFVMLMYLFMAFYLSLNIFEPGRIRKHGTLIRSLIYLFLCGLCAGLACAAKWQGVYAMLGLPVLFFYSINKRRLEFISHKCVKNVTESNIDFFPQYATITLAMCVIFFIIIPIVIYTLSYVPYLRTPGKEGIKAIIQNQKDMFGYHSDLESTHPYSSYWFQWPLMMRPIYYYAGTLANGLRTGITSFGNPAVWWTGIAAFFYCVRRQSKQFS
ncbi:MAG: phospholipid carrier-dependent glycosyltransferase, partial [Clostridiales bacterium]|nr:phospholipid carrier-dependent glycosyltransferase [Clostridiales bacterium]